MVLVLALGVRGMEEQASEQGFGWIDPLALDIGELPGWADPRWREEIDAALASVPVFRTDDLLAQAEMEQALASLSFVKRAEITEILWPDGLALRLALRRPVSCVPVENHFLNVSSDGVLLSGRWPAPPSIGSAYLPVIGPMADAWELFDLARPGDYLVEPEHLDALDVALSMDEHLDEASRAALGRVVIDARRAREVTVEEPGIRLLLEGGRMILFGRAPSSGEPGELEAEAKWSAVSTTLELCLPPEGRASGGGSGFRGGDPLDWSLADVRWDRPEIAPGSEALSRLASLSRPAEPPGSTISPISPRPSTSSPRSRPAASRSSRERMPSPSDRRPRVR
jgi:hypothetical protein